MTLVIFLILGVVALFAFRKPPILVGVAVAIYSFEQWAQVNSTWFVTHNRFLNYYSGVLAMIACGVVMLKGRNLLNPLPRAVVLIWILYVYAFVSVFWSINTRQSMVIVETFIPYIVIVVILTPLLIKDEKDLKTAILSILYIGFAVSLLLLFGTRIHDWGRTVVLESQMVVNRRGEFVDRLSPLTVAELGGLVILVAMLLRFKGINQVWSILKWLVFVVCIIQIFRSGSRGQLFAAVGVLCAFYGASRTKSKGGQLLRGAIGAAIMGAIALFVFVSYETISTTRWEWDYMVEDFSKSRLAMSGRLMEYWISSSPLRWLFGIGTAGSFDERVIGFYPHIVPIEVLGEMGLVGFFLYSMSIFFSVKAWFNLMSIHAGDKENRSYVAVLGALYVFSFVLTLKQGNFLSAVNFGLFSMLLYQYEALAVRNAARAKAARSYWMWRRMAVAQQATPNLQVQ